MKKTPTCIRLIKIYFKTLKQIFLLPYRKFKKTKILNTFSNDKNFIGKDIVKIDKNNGETQQNNKQTNDIKDGCAGCGCVLIMLWIIFAAVSWAWGIHWFFGVLMLIFLLAFFN